MKKKENVSSFRAFPSLTSSSRAKRKSMHTCTVHYGLYKSCIQNLSVFYILWLYRHFWSRCPSQGARCFQRRCFTAYLKVSNNLWIHFLPFCVCWRQWTPLSCCLDREEVGMRRGFDLILCSHLSMKDEFDSESKHSDKGLCYVPTQIIYDALDLRVNDLLFWSHATYFCCKYWVHPDAPTWTYIRITTSVL